MGAEQTPRAALVYGDQPPAPTAGGPLPTKTFEVGNVVVNAYTDPVNVRRSPGYKGKAASDMLASCRPAHR